jgi:hypothetical protein
MEDEKRPCRIRAERKTLADQFEKNDDLSRVGRVA